ncbi:MAG: PEGA domain-containing protein [Deltaproteobacteria bacterium]|nr:PEGA domain-containing protein [Deltaproteobacteria bacterium]MBT6433068.1 PEGA domain-containing protein [Deltaproteobacteria bacterium]MBT6488716.1 PEGA domain-containing protein [Deltaproteobacteria bacterium]
MILKSTQIIAMVAGLLIFCVHAEASQESVGKICKLKKSVNVRGTARGTGEKIRIEKGASFEIVRFHVQGKRFLFEGSTGKGWIHQQRIPRICKLSTPQPPKPEPTPTPDLTPEIETQPEPSVEAPSTPLMPTPPKEEEPQAAAVAAPAPKASAMAEPGKAESPSEPAQPAMESQVEQPAPQPTQVEDDSAEAKPVVPLPEVIVAEPAWIESADKFKLAVMDVEVTAPELDPLIGESMSSVLAAELAARSRGRFDVISRGDMRMMVGQVVEAQQLGCTDPSCLMDLGKLSSAEKMVTARIAKIGEDLVFTLELVDLVNGIVIARQAASWKGDPRGLVELCRPYLARLIEGSGADQYMGQLQVLANQDEAVVHLDNIEVGATPVELYPKIPIGRHRVQVKKPGFLLFNQDVVINHRETTLLQVELVDEDSLKPWYKKWWVWTGAAALVGGSVATAILLQNRETSVTFGSE